MWIGPTATHYTSTAILTQEEHILTWAIERQAEEPEPSMTVDVGGLDVMQAAAAPSVAGWDPLVLIEGPAADRQDDDAARRSRRTHRGWAEGFGVAPTAKAARVLEAETGLSSDTIAKVLHEHRRSDRPPLDRYQFAAGATVVVDLCRHRGYAEPSRAVRRRLSR